MALLLACSVYKCQTQTQAAARFADLPLPPAPCAAAEQVNELTSSGLELAKSTIFTVQIADGPCYRRACRL